MAYGNILVDFSKTTNRRVMPRFYRTGSFCVLEVIPSLVNVLLVLAAGYLGYWTRYKSAQCIGF